MKKKEISYGNKSIKKVVLFCVFVIFLIAVSFLIRFVVLVKESKFDAQNRFTIALHHEKENTILTFDPRNKQIAIAHVPIKKDVLPQQQLGVLLDGNIFLKNNFILPQSPSDILTTVLTNSVERQKDITEIDVTQLLVFSRSVQSKDVTEIHIKDTMTDTEIDKLVSIYFNDQQIIEEGKTVEIINATEISGIGKKLERMIKSSGGNVVSVSSTQNVEKTSYIKYYGESSYTLRKIFHAFKFPLRPTDERGIADITIVLGSDVNSYRRF